MAEFREIPLSEYNGNIFTEIGKRWAILTAGTPESFNGMTVSWGQAAVLWGQPVCTVYIRRSRHTYGFAAEHPKMTLCFFGEEHRPALRMYGSESGRDVDKTAKSGFEVVKDGEYVYYGEADTVFLLDCIYEDDLKEEGFKGGIPENYYPEGAAGLHRSFVCRIEKILIRA